MRCDGLDRDDAGWSQRQGRHEEQQGGVKQGRMRMGKLRLSILETSPRWLTAQLLFLQHALHRHEMLGFVVAHALEGRAQVEEILEFHALRHLHEALGEAQRLGRLGGEAAGELGCPHHEMLRRHHLEHHAQRLASAASMMRPLRVSSKACW